MEYTNLLKILHGDIALIDDVNLDDVALFKTTVIIKPSDVKKILHQYLIGSVTEEQLVKWAKFICLRSEYSCPDWESDVSADYYEDMFYVIQRISTPEIDGEINIASVKGYVSDLEKYEN